MNLKNVLICITTILILSACSNQSATPENKARNLEKRQQYDTKNFLPIVKVAARYPTQAILQGIEGSCVIEFTVTKKGTTKDHKVHSCSNRIFVKNAINAAKKFYYKPRVVDGALVEVPGVQNKFIFAIK